MREKSDIEIMPPPNLQTKNDDNPSRIKGVISLMITIGTPVPPAFGRKLSGRWVHNDVVLSNITLANSNRKHNLIYNGNGMAQ